MKYLIAGLGNIGPEYELTRHNAGFLILDYLAEDHQIGFEINKLAYTALLKYKGRQLNLIKPTTYMNLSGKAVKYWMDKLKVPVERCLVVTDDIALPFGKLRLRAKGSSAGHNGLKSIETSLDSRDYPRLRFGIGDDYRQGQQVDYVLSRFESSELEDLGPHLQQAAEAVLAFSTRGIDRAMNHYN